VCVCVCTCVCMCVGFVVVAAAAAAFVVCLLPCLFVCLLACLFVCLLACFRSSLLQNRVNKMFNARCAGSVCWIRSLRSEERLTHFLPFEHHTIPMAKRSPFVRLVKYYLGSSTDHSSPKEHFWLV